MYVFLFSVCFFLAGGGGGLGFPKHPNPKPSVRPAPWTMFGLLQRRGVYVQM